MTGKKISKAIQTILIFAKACMSLDLHKIHPYVCWSRLWGYTASCGCSFLNPTAVLAPLQVSVFQTERKITEASLLPHWINVPKNKLKVKVENNALCIIITAAKIFIMQIKKKQVYFYIQT